MTLHRGVEGDKSTIDKPLDAADENLKKARADRREIEDAPRLHGRMVAAIAVFAALIDLISDLIVAAGYCYPEDQSASTRPNLPRAGTAHGVSATTFTAVCQPGSCLGYVVRFFRGPRHRFERPGGRNARPYLVARATRRPTNLCGSSHSWWPPAGRKRQ